jgi:hypothetical protein
LRWATLPRYCFTVALLRHNHFQIKRPPKVDRHPRGVRPVGGAQDGTEHPKGRQRPKSSRTRGRQGIGQQSIENALGVLVQIRGQRAGQHSTANPAAEVPTAYARAPWPTSRPPSGSPAIEDRCFRERVDFFGQARVRDATGELARFLASVSGVTLERIGPRLIDLIPPPGGACTSCQARLFVVLRAGTGRSIASS